MAAREVDEAEPGRMRGAVQPGAMESVHAGVIHTLVGNLFYAASQWMISVFIVKAGGAAALGTYAISMAVISPLLALGNMNLRAVLVTDASRTVPFSHYFGLRLLSSGIGIVVTLVVLGFTPGLTFSGWVLGASVACYRFAEAIPDIIQGVFQKAGHMRYVANSLFLRTLAVFLVFSAFCFGLRQVGLSFFVLAVASLIITFVYDRRRATSWENSNPCLGRPALHLAWVALPLTAGALIGSIHLSIPRYYLNQEEKLLLGQFAALTNLMIIGGTLGSAIGANCSPRMAKQYVNGELKGFLRFAFWLLFVDVSIGLLGYIATALFGKELLTIAYNSEIAGAYKELPLFVLSLVLMLGDSHIGVALTAMRVFRAQLVIQVVKVFVCTTLCLSVYRNNASIASAAMALNWSLLLAVSIGVATGIYYLGASGKALRFVSFRP